MKKIIIWILILLSIASISYFVYSQYFSKKPNQIVEIQTDNSNQNNDTQTPVISEPDKQEVLTITYNEKPAKANAKYFEKVVSINGQHAYIAYPLTIEKDNPPRLIVYSHGSNTTVTKDLNESFMNDLQMYGEYFTKQGFAFAASNMHGANWGSSASVQDIVNLKNWISAKYTIQDKINILGFSMGGLPTFNYIFKYPKTVNSVALLAPTSRDYTQTQFKSIKSIPIHIWHGNKDVNVPLSLSTSLNSKYISYGYKNLELTIIDGKGHFDIDTELKKNILDFFKLHE